MQHTVLQTQSPESEPQELMHHLAVIARRLHRGTGVPDPLREAFKAGSLGPRHMPALISLARRGPMSVGELAGRLNLAPATVSLLLNDLNRAGMVERREDDGDRRRTIVSVHDEHRDMLIRLADERLDLLRRTLARLTPDARA